MTKLFFTHCLGRANRPSPASSVPGGRREGPGIAVRSAVASVGGSASIDIASVGIKNLVREASGEAVGPQRGRGRLWSEQEAYQRKREVLGHRKSCNQRS